MWHALSLSAAIRSSTGSSMAFRTTTCIAFELAFGLLHPQSVVAGFGDSGAGTVQSESRIEPFDAVPANGSGTQSQDVQCTSDGEWCARISADEQVDRSLIVLRRGREDDQLREVGRYPVAPDADEASLTVWPYIVRTLPSDGSREQTPLIGVVSAIQTMYSGGGAGAERLRLLQVGTTYNTTFQEVLSVPLSGWALIRACFSEDHVEQRAGACHDEYDFAAELTLRGASKGSVEFDYATTATSFPGPVSRTEDSLTNAPLTEKDLIHVVNDRCSYRRVVRFNAATERFEFDSPAPDCSEFTAP